MNSYYTHFYIYNYLLILCLSQTTIPPTSTTADDNNGEGEYTSIYITMIIIFSILFIVVIFCLIYRIYKKRQEENNTSTNKQSSKKKNDKNKKQENGTMEQQGPNDGNYNEEVVPQEQVKFRGSMSSVENRHERVPSKPVIIAITTPKGTRHVADAFGEYDGKDPENVKEELPGIDEDEEEDYGDDTQQYNKNNNNTQNNNNNNNNTTNTTNNNEGIIDIEDDEIGTEDIDISTPPINHMKHIKDKDKDRSFDSTESIENQQDDDDDNMQDRKSVV